MTAFRRRIRKVSQAALVFLVLLGAPSGSVLARPRGKNLVTKSGYDITITVPIDVLGLRGKVLRNPVTGEWMDAATYWEQGAEAIWNDGLDELRLRGCYTVHLDLQINPLGDFETVAEGHHWVWAERSGFRSKVFAGGGKNDDTPLPYTEDRWGQWGPVQPDTVAHEVGHFLGLGDDYTDVLAADGSFDHSEELPGREGTMMANYHTNPEGRIDQSIVDRLGDLLEAQVDLPPCISGVFETTVRDDTEGHERTATLGLLVTIKPDDTGALLGQAEGVFRLEGSVEDGDCTFSYNMSTPVALDLQASGSGDGPFTIDAVSEQKVEEVQRHYLCDNPVDLSIDWDVGLNIEDIVFEHGSYEFHDDTTNIQLAYSDPDFWNQPP